MTVCVCARMYVYVSLEFLCGFLPQTSSGSFYDEVLKKIAFLLHPRSNFTLFLQSCNLVSEHAEPRARPRYWIVSIEVHFRVFLHRTFVCAFILKRKFVPGLLHSLFKFSLKSQRKSRRVYQKNVLSCMISRFK